MALTSGEVKDLTDRPRLPRLGKIRLGIKLRNARGTEYPSATDFFVVPPEVQAVFGDKPRELEIVFPIDDVARIAHVAWKKYSATRGKTCTSDGEVAHRIIDKGVLASLLKGREPGKVDPAEMQRIYDAAIVKPDTRDYELMTIPCPARECAFAQDGTCRPVMILQFLIPRVAGVGIWQLDTGSVNSILNVRGGIELVKATTGGRLAGIPLTLRVRPAEAFPEGKKKVIFILDLFSPAKLIDMLAIAQRPIDQVFLPLPEPPDEDLPEELYPQSKTQTTPTVVGPTIDAKGEVKAEPAAEANGEAPASTEPTLFRGTDAELAVAAEVERLFGLLQYQDKNRRVLRRAHALNPLSLLKLLQEEAARRGVKV